jgi:acetoin utilization protein AcuB
MMIGPHERLIRDWMTRDPVTVPGSTTIPDAYWLMVEKDIHRLLVVDQDKLTGIVTMEDLRSVFQSTTIALNPLRMNQILSEMPVRQLMTKEPVFIEPDSTVLEAALLMLKHKISTLPILEKEKVVGLVTEGDLFRVLVDICKGHAGEKSGFEQRID